MVQAKLLLTSSMDRRYHKILEDLKSSSYQQVYQALVDLRTLLQTHRPSTTAQKLRKIGITKLLVRFLKKKYEKLVYLSLSILGTCCLELETRVMLQHEGLPRILMGIQAECHTDPIQSRICRCIGNLAALPAAAKDFHEAGAVLVLISIITSADTKQRSSETIQMAIRALRELGDTDDHRQTMIMKDAVRVIGDQMLSTDNDIVKASLKSIVSYCSCLDGAVQVERSCSKAGLEQLVKLAQTGARPELALLCICSIAHVAVCRPDLGKAGGISAIFHELKKPIHKSEPRTLITALSLFCTDIVNRVRLRDNNHLPDLLDLYKSERYSYLQDIVLAGLTKYTYDDISLKVLIDHGLVSVLITKLREHIHSLYPTKHSSTSLDIPDYCRRFSLDSEPDIDKSPSWQLNLSPNYYSPRRSPVSYPGSPSTSSHGMASPPATPPLTASCWSPPYSTCSGQTETYSPVYEDSSDDDNCDGLLESDEQSDIPKEEEDRRSYKINIFVLLHRISSLDWSVQELMIPSVVNTLLAYLVIGRLYISRAAIILAKIMAKHQFLLPLVHHRFAIMVFSKLNLRRHEDCGACSVHETIGNGLLEKAASVAEGPYGEGELAYLLQKGKEKDIQSTALTIPFVVRTCWLLKKLLLTHKGLQVITSLVTNDDESSCAILALSRLAKNLKISYSPPCSKVELLPDYQPGEVKSVVTFLLDDGSEVKADRTALGEASIVFHSMLQGGFKEAKEDVVKLQDISKETLILLLIYCKSYVDTNELIVGTPNVKYVLELFIVSDKFLITDLNSKLLDYTKQVYFNVDHFMSLYKSCNNSLDSTVNEVITLYEDACAYLLVGAMKHKSRVQLFNSIIQAGMWQQMQTYLSTLLSQRMEQGDFE